MTKTVVVIDNQVVARHMLRFALELQAYRVVEAVDVSGVLGVLISRNPDLLVIGVNQFTADCIELVGEVRRQPELSGLPILLIGEDRCKEDWNLRTIGNCVWLNKPFRLGELHGSVESLSAYAAHPAGLDRQRLGDEPYHGNGDV